MTGAAIELTGAMFFGGALRRSSRHVAGRLAALSAGGAGLYGALGGAAQAKAEPSLSELEGRMASIEAALKGPSAAAVEAKFTQFWPRKIMILFGPP